MNHSLRIGLASIVVTTLGTVGVHAQLQSEPNPGQERRNIAQVAQQANDQTRQPATEGVGRAEAHKARVEEHKTTVREKVEARKVQVKQDVCERKQKRLTAVIPKLSTSATTLLEKFNAIYGRVESFYLDKNLVSDNYDTAKADVDAAQAKADASVAAIADFTFTLDCENPNVAQQLDGLRASVKVAREDLAQYRKELVNYTQLVRGAAEEKAGESTTQTDPATEEVTHEN